MRQVLVISGKDIFDILYNKPAMNTPVLLDKLSKREDIKFLSVGNGSEDISLDEIKGALSQVNTNEPLTIIMQCHGSMQDGKFHFRIGEKENVSSESLFNVIKDHMPDKPIDFFTPACHGGGMMRDKDILPANSVLVSLTSRDMVNSGGDYCQMVSELDDFSRDFSSYNLLQHYMMNYLKSRFEPEIGVSQGQTINLNQSLITFTNSQNRQEIQTDETLKEIAINDVKYDNALNTLNTANNPWNILALEYGTALGILLNEGIKSQEIYIPNNSITPQEQ